MLRTSLRQPISPVRVKRFLFLLVVLSAISGCAHSPRVSKTPASQPTYNNFAIPQAAVQSSAGFYHTVQKGQTIYRIAKNYGLDWHELAFANNISDPSALEVGQKILIPGHQSYEKRARSSAGPLTTSAIRRLVGPPRSRSDWRTITLHHSGTHKGGAKAFHRDHTRRHMGGLFYHFVIGNGSSTPDGALEVGFRWKKQIIANRPHDIQICLVGDFNSDDVSDAQFSTMVQLVKMLQSDYGISVSSVRRHDDVPGKNTECPGAKFPFSKILSYLSRSGSIHSQ